ncbi:MAG: hypothetical protein SFZ23_16190 [Planctomycetota bacterium]|nr:hypothetical protein [Planctomycetota bacterium]
MSDSFRLRRLGLGVRLGIACMVLVLMGGFAASVTYIFQHHGKKDGEPELTLTDVQGAYHGVDAESPLRRALENNHPPEMPEAARQALLKWLASDRIAQDYDNLDLGENAPAELIAANCLSCHSRKVADTNPIANKYPLDYFDDIKKIAFAKKLTPPSIEILTVSTHTHALALGSLSVVVAALALASGWSRRFMGLLIFASGFGLLLDLGSWWLARQSAVFVYGIIVGGGMYSGSSLLLLGAVLLDLFLPAKADPRPTP